MNSFNVCFKLLKATRDGASSIRYDFTLHVNHTCKKFSFVHDKNDHPMLEDIIAYSKQCNRNKNTDSMFLKAVSRFLFLKYNKHFCNKVNYIYPSYYNLLGFFNNMAHKQKQNILNCVISSGICPMCGNHIDMGKIFTEFINNPDSFNNDDLSYDTDDVDIVLKESVEYVNGFFKNENLTYISPKTNKNYSFTVTPDGFLYLMNGIFKLIKIDNNQLKRLCDSEDEYEFANNITLIYENNYCGLCDTILVDGIHCIHCNKKGKKLTDLHRDFLVESILNEGG